MNCPPEVAEILLEILQNGLLRIRALGWGNNAARCAVEADHLHNLPGLLMHFSADGLRYYWEVERPAFVAQGDTTGLPGFQTPWDRLSALVPSESVVIG
jgi:hypothetical protein